MRGLALGFAFVLLVAMGADVPAFAAAPGSDPAALLEQRDFLALQALLDSDTALTPDEKAFYEGVLAVKKNRLEESLRLLGPLLKRKPAPLTPELLRIGFAAEADSYVRLFRYRDAADTFGRMLRTLKGSMSDTEAEEYRQQQEMVETLKDAPAQTVVPGTPSRIPLSRNKIGLIELPVSISGSDRAFVMDTGANFSLVTQSAAQELGLKLSERSAPLTRTGGVKVEAHTAIIPALGVGNAAFRNVVVLVAEDKDFYIREVDFQLRQVLGYPVLSALGNITIARSGTLATGAPPEPQAGTTSLWLDGLTPLIAIKVDDRARLFVLDSGARHSYLTANFFENHQDLFAGKTPGTMNLGGGKSPIPAFGVKQVTFGIGDASVTFANVPVATAKTGTVSDPFYGIIGQDLLSRFESYTLDFRAMTFSVGAPLPEPAKP